MKKCTTVFAMILAAVTVMSLFVVKAEAAVTKSIHTEWGYAPPSSPAVTGYKFYQEGKLVYTAPGAAITAADFPVILSTKNTVFTMTAAFADNTESEQSAPFTFVYTGPLQPGPAIKSVIISGTDFTITPVK